MAQAYTQLRGELVIRMDASASAAFSQFTNQAQRAGDSGARSMDRFNRSVEGLEGRLRAAGAGIGAFSGHGGRLASQFNAAANAIAITGGRIGGLIAAVAGGATLVGATNDIQNYTARLRAATNGQAEFNSVYANLLRVSSATRSDLGETINFYTRLRIATSQLSLSQNELGGIIQTVQQSIRLSGAGAQEANAALIQFVQGISSANGLSGDEFKSLGENATLVLRNIAIGLKELNTFPGFDGTISALRKLGSEGKLTADVIVPALQQVFARVDADFKRLPPTIDQASTALRNSFLDLIVQGEKATGALSGLANGMLVLSRNFDTVGIVGASLAGLFAGRLVPLAISLTGLVLNTGRAMVALAVQTALSTAAMTAFGGAGFRAAGSMAAVRAAGAGLVAFFGGPWALALAGAAAAVTFLATQKSQLAIAAEKMGTSEDELRGRVKALTDEIFRQNSELEKNERLKGGVVRAEAQANVQSTQSVLGSQRAALAGAFARAARDSNAPVDGSQFFRLLNSGADVSALTKEIVRLSNASSAFAKQINVAPGAVDRLFGNKSLKDTLTDFGVAQDLAKRATAEVVKLADGFDSIRFGTGAGADGGAVRTLKEVVAASKEGATAADRAREAVIALNKEFGIAGEKEFAKLSADRQNEYARRLTAIEQTKKAEIEAEKAAAAARRQGIREARKDERDWQKDREAEADKMRDIMEAAAKAERDRLQNLGRLRVEDQGRLAILGLEAEGQLATAAALNLMIQRREVYGGLTKENLRDSAAQIEAEARINVAIERRNQLLAIESRALGQIQNAFTTLFTGNTRGFLSGIGDAFRQQFAQRLSLNIFGDAERDAQLANTGALEVNTGAIERLIAAMDVLGTRITAPPEERGSPGPALGVVAANDNRPGNPVTSLATSAKALDNVSRLFRDQATKDFIGSNQFGAFGARAGARFGSNIGQTLDRVFGRQSVDAQGEATGFARSFGRVGAGIGAAGEGASAGQAVVSILDDIGVFDSTSKSSRTGGNIGTAGGAAIGFAFGGPAGAAIGAFIGNIVGSTIGAAFKKNPFGDVALRAGQSGTVFNSRGAGSGEQALTLADSVNQGLERLAQGLGVNLRTGANIGAIGFSGSQFFFNPTGGDFKAAGNQRFSEAEDAVAAAIRNAVSVGAFEGLREGSKRLLLAGADINAQAQKAADFEGVFTELRRAVDPTGAAVDELNKKFTRLSGIFVEAGANADEFGKLQQLYDLQRAQALEQANSTLRDFLTELTTSSGSGLSVRDRQSAAQSAFAGFRSDIEAGRTINQDAFRTAAQNLLDVNRELFGSQTGYFDTLSLVTDLTRRAISTTEGQQSLPEALRLANGPVTDGLSAVRGAIEAGFANLEDALARMNMAPANDWAGVGSGFTARQGGF